MQELVNSLGAGPRGEYKNEMISANTDFITINDSVNWNLLSDIDIEIDCGSTVSAPTASRTLLSKGSFGTGLVLIRYFQDQITVDIDDSAGNPIVDTEQYQLYSSDDKIVLRNLKLYINGSLIDTYTDGTLSIHPTNTNVTLSKLSYTSAWYLDGFISRLKLGTETFDLNEANGTTVFGDEGTTGTRSTGHAGGLSYINNEMIKRIG